MDTEKESQAATASKPSPEILWDVGTAYDMFISLHVLHNPSEFGLRGAWAAGVRSRLPSPERELLEELMEVFYAPFPWIYSLPEPKDADTVLYHMKQIPAEQRIPELFFSADMDEADRDIMLEVSQKGAWTEGQRDQIAKRWSEHGSEAAASKKVEKWLNLSAKAGEYGAPYLSALQAYQDVFFAEEEKRIRPKLEEALERAQKLAEKLPPADLLEDLSQGFRFTELPAVKKLLLVPSYWGTPLVIFSLIDKETELLTFGARPPGDSLVPGEVVPDALLQALKALADPTRLRILRYLTQEKLSPAELSRRLRLRAPTVTHHLHALRLAGLVRFTLEEHKGKSDQRLYWAHLDSVNAACEALDNFLVSESMDVDPDQIMERGRER